MVQYISRMERSRLGEDEVQLSDRHAQALWSAWQVGGNDAIREQLIGFYMPFARMLAAKAYARRTFVELEFMDFLQYGSLGLIEAIERFNPARGVSFETFAGLRINGAILSGIETLSEKQVQVSARKRLINSRVQSLGGLLGGRRYPGGEAQPGESQDDYGLDAESGTAQPEIDIGDNGDADAGLAEAGLVLAHEAEEGNDVFARLAGIAIGLALGFALEDTGMMQPDEEPQYVDMTYRSIEMKQLHIQLQHWLALLPEKENRILSYHYLQHLGFDEIALILKLSRGRVSQLHKQALLRLRNNIAVQGSKDFHF